MNLTVTFESAELRFKQILEDFFISKYDEKSLSSHGIDHHRRVWKYAKELTVLISEHNNTINPEISRDLIIACYLHDIGMSVDHGIKHGRHGRELCVSFMKKNNLEENEYRDVLLAIENHDNKEYKTSASKNDLLTILSVADDLDAFGFTGIYRYSEIYLMRGENLSRLGELIISNAQIRFDNFIKIFGFSDELVMKHSEKYKILIDFFKGYNKQVASYKFGKESPSGYCRVVDVFRERINSKEEHLNFQKEMYNHSDDNIVKWYFTGLEKELSSS
jgi:hypothetical protein